MLPHCPNSGPQGPTTGFDCYPASKRVRDLNTEQVIKFGRHFSLDDEVPEAFGKVGLNKA